MGRAPCCSKVGLHRGPWTPREDALLTSYIQTHGEGCWRSLPKKAGLLRCGKSCRLRWMNYLRPDIKRGNIGPEEEDLIIRLHCLLGNRWSLIAGRLPGRTDNEIKNYWNTHLSKKLKKHGFIPREETQRFKRSESSRKKKMTKIDNSNISTKQSAHETAASDVDHDSKIYAPKPTRFTPRLVRNCSVVESSEELGFDHGRLGMTGGPAAEEEKLSPAGSTHDDLLYFSALSDNAGEEAENINLFDQQQIDFPINDTVFERLFYEYSQLLQAEVDFGQMNDQFVY